MRHLPRAKCAPGRSHSDSVLMEEVAWNCLWGVGKGLPRHWTWPEQSAWHIAEMADREKTEKTPTTYVSCSLSPFPGTEPLKPLEFSK